MIKQFDYTGDELELKLSECVKNGVTELSVHDAALAKDKGRLLKFLKSVEREAPDVFVSFLVDPANIDRDLCRQCMNINCSVEMKFSPEPGTGKGQGILFDKKFYSRRCVALNNSGLVFGVYLSFADTVGDSLKAFFDRLDFTVAQYPNHIDFPQTEDSELMSTARVSGLFSAENIRLARDVAFAARTFYSAGRAVPWFLSVLKPLKMPASKFFSDFAEWQRVNNCDFKSGFVPECVSHEEIEKMQLNFLQIKYEEKHAMPVFAAVKDIVRLNGAFSRVVSDGKNLEIETGYNPDDLLSPECMDVENFANDVCMEQCKSLLFLTDEGPDYKVL